MESFFRKFTTHLKNKKITHIKNKSFFKETFFLFKENASDLKNFFPKIRELIVGIITSI